MAAKKDNDNLLRPLLVLVLTGYALLSGLSTLATYIWFPREYRPYLCWILLALTIVAAVIAVDRISRLYEDRMSKLEAKIAALSKHPYDNALRRRVHETLGSLSGRNQEIVRVILMFRPISAHDLASRMGNPSVEAMRNEINALRGSQMIDLKSYDGTWKYEILPQSIQPIKDYLYPAT